MACACGVASDLSKQDAWSQGNYPASQMYGYEVAWLKGAPICKGLGDESSASFGWAHVLT
jgi:hypothetical protein